MSEPHYAEAFAADWPGCFRFIADQAGRPEHCPAAPAWTGTFRAGDGRRYTVRACEGHRGGLEDTHRLTPKEGKREGSG
jgi:hypothetical protein